MPFGNKFGVGELWEGVKKAVQDAWNAVAQTFTGIIKEVRGLAVKYLPMVLLISKVVSALPNAVKEIAALIRRLPNAFNNVGKTITNAIKGILRTLEIAVRTTVKLLQKALEAGFKRLPKEIQSVIKTIIEPIRNALKAAAKEITKVFNEFSKLRNWLQNQLNKVTQNINKGVRSPISEAVKTIRGLFNGITKTINGVTKTIGDSINRATKPIGDGIKGLGQSVDKIFREIDTKVRVTVAQVTKEVDSRVKSVTQSVDRVTREAGKQVENNLRQASKATEKVVDDVGKTVGKTSQQVLELPGKVAQETTEKVSKATQSAVKALEDALKVPIKVVQNTADDVGKNVGKVAGKVDDVAKQVPKMAGALDDVARAVPKLLSAVTAMLPIVEGLTEYLQFEEVFQRLDRIEQWQLNTAWEQLLKNNERTTSVERALNRLIDSIPTNGNPSQTDLKPFLDAVRDLKANLPKNQDLTPISQGITAMQAKLNELSTPTINTGQLASDIAAKMPKVTVDNQAIATAVKNKLDPTLKTIDGKLPDNGIYRVDQTGIAKAVDTLIRPALKTIDGKLPDNGIFRVDQTGIANTVADKLKTPTQQVNQTQLLQDLQKGVTSITQNLTQQFNQQNTTIVNNVKQSIPADIAKKGDLKFSEILLSLTAMTTILKVLEARKPVTELQPQLKRIEDNTAAAQNNTSQLLQRVPLQLPQQMQRIEDEVKKQATKTISVKVWDSTAKRMTTRLLRVPDNQAEATELLANEAAEAQEDSHNERNGIKATLKRIADRLQIIRVLTIMGNIASLHNAAMLSRNLAGTLGDAASTVLTAIRRMIGIPQGEAEINVNEYLGKEFNEFMEEALGADVWAGTKTNWNKANRILTAASSIVSSIRSIGDSARAIAEFTANNTGRIGNALKKFGVVGENAYPWMSTNVTARTAFQAKIDRFREGVENLDDAASALTSVAGESINIMDEAQQIKEQWNTLDNAIKNAEEKPQADNKPRKDKEDASKASSQGKELDSVDIAISGEES